MFKTKTEILSDGVHKYIVFRDDASISYADTCDLWQRDDVFRSFFISLLAESPFSAYRWETPPITTDTANRRFEFVLLNAPYLARPADRQPFASYFTDGISNEGTVAFENLGKDAVLVVPCPRGPESAYSHLAAFIRYAPKDQKHLLWRIVGKNVQNIISDYPLWVSTAGGGVDWLHVRLDSRPKYYGYTPYKVFDG